MLAIALSVFGPAASAAITPQSDVLLPWFEVDLQHNTAVATAFSLVNASPNAVQTQLTVYTNWGIPVLQVPLDFARTEAKSINLRAWIADGVLPGRTLTPAELANLQAQLTGHRSPIDNLYYSTPVSDGDAVGYVIAQTLADRPDTLWGDTYNIDTSINDFQAETLVALTHDLHADCNRHGVRFVNQGTLYEGTELIIWSGRRFQPSATPTPGGSKVKITLSVYDQAGNHVQDCPREFIAVESLQVCQLNITPPIGWLDVTTEDPTYILEHLHSTTQSAAELHSYCLTESLQLAGPSITLKKRIAGDDADSPPGPQFQAGDLVKFEYVVTNTGTVVLNPVVVTDDKGLDVTCPKATLTPAESMTCTAQTIAAGCINVNVGTATGIAPDGTSVNQSDVAFYDGAYAPALTLKMAVNGAEADQPPGPFIDAGDPAHWTFAVTNSGNAPFKNIVVSITNGTTVTCPKSNLDPLASMTCSAQSLALEGQQHEIGTATGTDPCGVAATASDPAYYFGRKNIPSIVMKKYVGDDDADSAPGPTLPVGTTVPWRFIVTNTGNVTLNGIVIADDHGITPNCPKTTLEPGESMTCTASSLVLPCQQSNTATVTASPAQQQGTVTAHDSAHYFGGGNPAVALELKLNGDPADTPPGPWIDENAPIVLTYEVTNSGNVELTNLVVNDDRGSVPVCPKNSLLPGQSMTCSAQTLAVAGTHVIMGAVTGRSPCGDPVDAHDPANYRGRALTPGIDVIKMTNGIHVTAPPGPSVPVGSAIHWTYLVTNTGMVQLTNVSVTDSRGVAVSCPKTVLAPAESMTCTASGIAQACQYTNTATAQGQPSTGAAVTARDDSFYFGQNNASITIDKKANGQDSPQPPGQSITAGAQIQWTFVVKNTGDVALSQVVVTDDRAGAVACPKTTLATSESMTCSASSTALAGQQKNTASVSGNPPCGNKVTATDSSYYLGVVPGIRLDKLINGNDADDAAHAVQVASGAHLTWSFVVTNIGEVRLTNVAVTDNVIHNISCPKTALDPGQSMTCTVFGDAQRGVECDIGQATGVSPQGATVISTDPACYNGTSSGKEGCSPGYWKNHAGSWSGSGYSPTQTILSVFSKAALYPTLSSSSLMDALGFPGGSGTDGAARILLRAATAALLNASNPSVSYPRTPASVITDVNNALATQNRDTMLSLAGALDADNNLSCPLN